MRMPFQFLAGRRNGQLAMLDALGGDQLIGHGLDLRSGSPHCEDFHAVMMIEVDMQGGNDPIPVLMLNIGQ